MGVGSFSNLLAELLSDRNNIPFIFAKFKWKNKASISERSDYGYVCILTDYGEIKETRKIVCYITWRYL